MQFIEIFLWPFNNIHIWALKKQFQIFPYLVVGLEACFQSLSWWKSNLFQLQFLHWLWNSAFGDILISSWIHSFFYTHNISCFICSLTSYQNANLVLNSEDVPFLDVFHPTFLSKYILHNCGQTVQPVLSVNYAFLLIKTCIL